MTDQQADIRFEVRPTAPQVTDQYSDISLTGLFNVHAGQINSERQTIWQRYNIMLVANSVILGFLVGGTREKFELTIGVIFGLLLCFAWLIITVSGFNLFFLRRQRALQFVWINLDPQTNPFEVSTEYERGIRGGWIYVIALLTIALFVAVHILILIRQLLTNL